MKNLQPGWERYATGELDDDEPDDREARKLAREEAAIDGHDERKSRRHDDDPAADYAYGYFGHSGAQEG